MRLIHFWWCPSPFPTMCLVSSHSPTELLLLLQNWQTGILLAHTSCWCDMLSLLLLCQYLLTMSFIELCKAVAACILKGGLWNMEECSKRPLNAIMNITSMCQIPPFIYPLGEMVMREPLCCKSFLLGDCFAQSGSGKRSGDPEPLCQCLIWEEKWQYLFFETILTANFASCCFLWIRRMCRKAPAILSR